MTDEQLAFDWGGEQEPVGAAQALLPRAAALAERLRSLARRGVLLGTSSWKYPGWLGQVYTSARYETRGRFSEQKFNQQCLIEYAGIFPAVCGDFAFYQFPSASTWQRIFEQVPRGFGFSLKVPEDITVERFPDLPRYGRRAGQDNPHFMDAALVQDQLLDCLEPYRDRLGVLIFEFGTIHRERMREAKEFTAALDHMLSRLSTERFRFAVEVRNRNFLWSGSRYLDCLRDHGVAHCLNSWTRMPSLAEQCRLEGVLTADHVVARCLLRPGRNYRQAVEEFAPYERIQDPYPEGRDALADLINTCLSDPGRSLFAFVNNRWEGNAVETIEQIVERID